MQGHIEQITIEQALQTAERVFIDCVKEEYENILPNAVITVYIKKPEFHEKGADSGFMFKISDDTVTEEELEYQLRSHQELLTQRFLNKAATYPNSKRSSSVNNRIKFLGLILETGWSISQAESTELSEADKSDFIEIAKINIKRNKKDWGRFWDKVDKAVKFLNLAKFLVGDVDFTDFTELINFVRDKIEDFNTDVDFAELIKKIMRNK